LTSKAIGSQKKSGTEWDWGESLTQKEIIKVCEFNNKISDHLDSPVTVMYFVKVDKRTGYPSILPWYYTTEEVTESSQRFTDVIFAQKRFLIQTENDFEELKTSVAKGQTKKITITLKLNPDLLRDKDLLETIGSFSKEHNISIELQGSILSHTYYILRKMDVSVKTVDPFDPQYDKQFFYKLVRDKIPINIESKGEKARV